MSGSAVILCEDLTQATIIRGFKITGGSYGIRVMGGVAALTIQDNLITANLTNQSGVSIRLENGAAATILNNTIQTSARGIEGLGNNAVSIEENTISDCRGSYGGGIYLRNAQSPRILKNTIVGIVPGPGHLESDPLFVDTLNYGLGLGSPCINAGDPTPAYNDVDGTHNDMGIYGGPQVATESQLSVAYQERLTQYAQATVRYFTSPQSNDKLAGFTHAFFGEAPVGGWRECNDSGSCTFRSCALTRGYGSHVNINEVTLRFLALAVAYKMDWLDYLPSEVRYAESWGQIKTGLETLRLLQTSGNAEQYHEGTFHRAYITTTDRGGQYDLDRTPAEITRTGAFEQSSDDNLASYSVEAQRLAAIAAYFDSGTPIPPELFPGPEPWPLTGILSLNATGFRAGDPLRLAVRLITGMRTPPPGAYLFEAKIWLKTPLPFPWDLISILNLAGPGQAVALPPGFDQTIPLIDTALPADLPAGAYEFGLRLLDPVTGQELAVDTAPFEVRLSP